MDMGGGGIQFPEASRQTAGGTARSRPERPQTSNNTLHSNPVRHTCLREGAPHPQPEARSSTGSDEGHSVHSHRRIGCEGRRRVARPRYRPPQDPLLKHHLCSPCGSRPSFQRRARTRSLAHRPQHRRLGRREYRATTADSVVTALTGRRRRMAALGVCYRRPPFLDSNSMRTAHSRGLLWSRLMAA